MPRNKKKPSRWKCGPRVSAWEDALRFVLVFALVAGVVYLLTEPLALFLRTLASQSAAFLLNLFGVPTQTYLLNGEPFLRTDGLSAAIIDLCSGRLELAVLFGVIFASADRSLRNRVAGALGALAFVLVLNPVRIALTVQFFSPFLHEVLFRLTILVLIIGYYALWYLGPWARGR